ncbi:polysaccharide deacetylase family protein [Azospirillum sp. TSO35-2]|uniref:polysaccharide deacetylase family protein n=1 Tax=Azospirillum sp. TSO35-2 TaxID=716796 RepID=UPI000D611525|nr:polysaccharide deacetylase family protein [Azospirillum sp. TSO35-2]PWC33115.1 chitooligosaccharide deacetylase [Azospirillum sp. TSO35-2]
MLSILWLNASPSVPSSGAVGRIHARSFVNLARGGAGLLSAALLAGVLVLPPSHPAGATETRNTQRAAATTPKPAKPAAAAKPAATPAKVEAKAAPAAAPAPAAADTAPADGPILQLGIYSGDGDAWWSWQNLQRREPELTAGLSASVMLLDGKSGAGGVALYARVASGADPKALCRKIVGAGFGCLAVDRPPPGAAPITTAKAATDKVAADKPGVGPTPKPASAPPVTVAKAEAPAPAPVAPAPVASVAAPAMPAAAPAAPAKSQPPTATVAVAPPSAEKGPAEKGPAEKTPAEKAQAPSPGTTTSMLAPIGSAVAAPMVPAPPSVATAVAPPDGTIIYSEEDARTMADIEQHSRRKGRLRSVMPDSRYDVMPATLKKENWNLCALTFDDGPHRTVTRQVLDILNREGVRATYFPVGRIAENQGDLIRDFITSGHEIGNHSLTHSDLRKMDAAGARFEIAETNRILRGFGANPVLFRPPYGRYSDELLTIAREEHMGSVLWSVDTRDWKVRNADKIVSQINLAGTPGNVFLMHSTYATTAQALPRVIAELRAKGCEFVTLSEWLERARTLALPKIVNADMPSPPAAAATGRP